MLPCRCWKWSGPSLMSCGTPWSPKDVQCNVSVEGLLCGNRKQQEDDATRTRTIVYKGDGVDGGDNGDSDSGYRECAYQYYEHS